MKHWHDHCARCGHKRSLHGLQPPYRKECKACEQCVRGEPKDEHRATVCGCPRFVEVA